MEENVLFVRFLQAQGIVTIMCKNILSLYFCQRCGVVRFPMFCRYSLWLKRRLCSMAARRVRLEPDSILNLFF
jgi:hypothetical protein